MRYKLVQAQDAHSLTAEVSSYLAAGWKPQGSPFVILDGRGYAQFYQAIVLENS